MSARSQAERPIAHQRAGHGVAVDRLFKGEGCRIFSCLYAKLLVSSELLLDQTRTYQLPLSYDEETLRKVLEEVGFGDISRVAFDPSIDSKHREIGSLVVIAQKPAQSVVVSA